MAVSDNLFSTVPRPGSKPSQRLSSSSGVEVPANVYKAVEQASARSGVSFAYLMTKAQTESSFNPEAQAKTSSASGLYQFIERTWLDMVDKHGAEYGLGKYADAITRKQDGTPVVANKALRQEILALRKDPEISAYMAAEYASENKAYLEKQLGRTATDTDLYMAHFLGAGGAAKFLKAMDRNGNQAAAAVMPAAANANRNVFYSASSGRALSLDQVYARFDKKFDTGATYYAEGSSPADAATVQTAAVDAEDTTPVQYGAVPGATTPFFTTYLMAALEAPGEAEQEMFPSGYRQYGAIGSYGRGFASSQQVG